MFSYQCRHRMSTSFEKVFQVIGKYSSASKYVHIPLTYVKNTSGKGPVSQFVLDNLSSLDYTIEYRQGCKLVEAGAVSRFPCLGPKELAPDGVKEAFNVLLASLPKKWENKGRVWVFAQKETEIIQQSVRQWLSMMSRDKKEPVRRTSPVHRISDG